MNFARGILLRNPIKPLDTPVEFVLLEVQQHGDLMILRDGENPLHGRGVALEGKHLLADPKPSDFQEPFNLSPRLG